MRRLALFTLVGSFLCCVPVFAQEDDRADSTYDEDYRLYDRNERNKDFNPYNFPASRRPARGTQNDY